ncbi:hypothetical protein Trydic_g5750, partial [Trypoxylus dichotomus]
GGTRTRRIRFLRGVKQGVPLSPMLFNMVLDEVLEDLNAQINGGTLSSGDMVAAIAFADDVHLLHDEDACSRSAGHRSSFHPGQGHGA